MDREAIVNRIGAEYHTVNVEHEWSYIADAGNKETLLTRLGDAAYNKILSLGKHRDPDRNKAESDRG